MRLEDCFFLGTITKKHGTNGGLVLKLDTDRPENYYNLESALLNIDGELIPFFISDCTVIKTDQLRLFFEEISPRETDRLLGIEVFLPLDKLPKLSGKNFYYHEVINFKAIDAAKGHFGEIVQVIDRPEQPIFEIAQGEKLIYIPAIDLFIESIDRTEKVIYLNCPEGLIDLYL
jgi:16S rRNA processing protein RimM